ncbi:bis(5'-nucleosyl)-tetraphosphatase PrpE [Thalassobacillus pellis]|uniref:bis(5'-nucleosyl)-tetraphosphatase PrpE n=1 Tax=Thalassobacillus pellis TaxID=748008 RepID=UPI001960480E|nr:bis(5'-nucleosyl)-tetraphosphatase PrpE [Thalassobacillus pellis]MBM7554013.1 diadenosine tetraphosphatase ApaH/serine/threonine PP2A family protein phosphatase [Thalassobacillus pellis]
MKIDVIGDVHGCLDELKALFDKLEYEWKDGMPSHPDNRVPVFVGDITDRGPASVETIRFVYELVMERKSARYLPGNHCNKLYRYFHGNPVKEQHGLETTTAEYKALPPEEREEVRDKFMELMDASPLYLEIPEIDAVIAHAGIRQDYIGQHGKKVKTFVLYGDITGEKHEDGRPVRRDWAQSYQGDKWIIYGHTPTLEPRFVNKTVNIDTGCVFGNKLTAFRLPEEAIVSVPSSMPFVEEKFRY